MEKKSVEGRIDDSADGVVYRNSYAVFHYTKKTFQFAQRTFVFSIAF